MKPQAFDYVAPDRLEQALDALARGGPDARVLAGGQSLVPIMNLRLATPSLLVDLNRVQALAGIDTRPDGSVRIGAMTRHSDVENSDTIRQKLPLLHAAMPYIAHTQIRNRGTVGGSLAHADPSAEWPALCVALGAKIVARRSGGTRTIAADQFSQGFLTTALAPDEILTEVVFPPSPAGRRWGFKEISRRRGDFAIVGVACTADVLGDGTIASSRIVIFGVAAGPVLATAAAECLRGHRVDAGLAREAARAAVAATDPRADIHASADYRRQLVETLVARAVEQVATIASVEEAAKDAA